MTQISFSTLYKKDKNNKKISVYSVITDLIQCTTGPNIKAISHKLIQANGPTVSWQSQEHPSQGPKTLISNTKGSPANVNVWYSPFSQPKWFSFPFLTLSTQTFCASVIQTPLHLSHKIHLMSSSLHITSPNSIDKLLHIKSIHIYIHFKCGYMIIKVNMPQNMHVMA